MRCITLATMGFALALVLATSVTATEYRACDVLDLRYCTTVPYPTYLRATDLNDACQIVGRGIPYSYTTFIWQQGTVQDLGEFPGVSSDYVFSVNAAGNVVGNEGFWSHGGLTVLEPPAGYDGVEALGINDSNTVVGFVYTHTGSEAAFAWDGATGLRLLPALPGANSACAEAVNSRGQMVGWSTTPTGTCVACLWEGGAVVPLGTLSGDKGSKAHDINDAGVVVGESWRDAPVSYRAFRWDSGGMQQLPGPGTGDSRAYGISSTGLIAGVSNRVPALWENGTCIPLPLPAGYSDGEARRVNNLGWVLGWSLGYGESYRSLVWRPAPAGDSSVAAARNAIPWSVVRIADAQVTAGPEVETGSAFVSSRDRIAGIRVVTKHALQVGQRVQFTGTVKRVDGEYQITDALFEDVATGEPLQPLCLNLKSLANDRTETLNYCGINTTGMLVRLAGRVTANFSTANFIYLDDGSGYEDGVSPPPYNLGIRVYFPPGVPKPAVGSHVTVTGISRVKKHFLYAWSQVNDEWHPPESLLYVPSVWLRDANDVVTRQ